MSAVAKLPIAAALAAHPAAELFPLMQGPELDDLASDIKQNGLLEPIKIWQGQMIDGRNRLKACRIAKVEPAFAELKKLPAGGAIAYVISRNLKRRHLTTSQRALLAAHAAELMADEAAARKREGGAEGGKTAGKGRPKAGAPKGPKPKREDKSITRAAKAAGVGKNQAQTMAAVQKRAPDVAAAVQSGTVKTVSDAKRLAEVESPKERAQALALVKTGEPVGKAIAQATPLKRPNGSPTHADLLKTIERLMNESRPLAERLQHKLHGIVQNARRVGLEKVGGLGGFRVGVELTSLRVTLDELKGMFP